MNKLISLCFLAIIISTGCSAPLQLQPVLSEKKIEQNFKHVIAELNNPHSKEVLVAAHRGDWRGTPENSIQALRNSIHMGVDIVELDLKKTKDGHLIIMHDNTINRTTTGKGKPEDYTLAEIKKMYLRKAHGPASNHRVPTFEEFMLEAKGKMVVNVDKGDGYYKEIFEVLERTGTLQQALVKTYYSAQKSVEVNGLDYMKKFMFLPIVNLDKPGSYQQFAEFDKLVKPFAYELVFDKDSSQFLQNPAIVKNTGAKIWINSLWKNLCAGHDDDMAVEENKPDESWGWIIKRGANIIQTDRPAELLQYLRKKKLHK